MNRLRTAIRRFGSAMTLATVLLILGTQWVAGVHHHDASSARTCAVCSTAHTPAVISIAVTRVTAPRPVETHVPIYIAVATIAIAVGIAPSRAPPLS